MSKNRDASVFLGPSWLLITYNICPSVTAVVLLAVAVLVVVVVAVVLGVLRFARRDLRFF